MAAMCPDAVGFVRGDPLCGALRALEVVKRAGSAGRCNAGVHQPAGRDPARRLVDLNDFSMRAPARRRAALSLRTLRRGDACAHMSEQDLADAEWTARAVRDSIRRALLMAAAEFAMWARLVK